VSREDIKYPLVITYLLRIARTISCELQSVSCNLSDEISSQICMIDVAPRAWFVCFEDICTLFELAACKLAGMLAFPR
jgi:hypothetical protein